jgi:acetone carboxylase gamma subunit
VQCTWCGENISDADTHWKEAAVRAEQPFPFTDPPPSGEAYFLRSFFCPSCGTSLDVEPVRNDDGPLLDVIHRWPDVAADRASRDAVGAG